jgi:uncharacterized protein (DUF849 family)
VETPAIIEAAVNGVTSKRDNPNVPRSPGEIADDAQPCRPVASHGATVDLLGLADPS